MHWGTTDQYPTLPSFLSSLKMLLLTDWLSTYLRIIWCTSFNRPTRNDTALLTALVHVHHDIVSAVDKERSVCFILSDLSTTFDSVDHTILRDFLENHIGLGEHALNFSRSYLADMTQRVSVKDALSEMNRLSYGVSQGSVLRPIDFFHSFCHIKSLQERLSRICKWRADLKLVR